MHKFGVDIAFDAGNLLAEPLEMKGEDFRMARSRRSSIRTLKFSGTFLEGITILNRSMAASSFDLPDAEKPNVLARRDERFPSVASAPLRILASSSYSLRAAWVCGAHEAKSLPCRNRARCRPLPGNDPVTSRLGPDLDLLQELARENHFLNELANSFRRT